MTQFLTLTVNPALDLSCAVPTLIPAHKMRVAGYLLDPGGGGINVARVLHRLGGVAHALVLLGGHTGAWVADLLRAEGVAFTAVPVGGSTRISISLHEASTAHEFRVVPEGEPLNSAEAEAALLALADHQTRWIVASGSLAPGLPDDFYRQVVGRKGGALLAVDTSGRGLLALRGAGIDLLKLSAGELGSLTGAAVGDASAAATALVKDGTAGIVAVTLGEAGALLASADGIVRVPARQVAVRSTVGAGDAFLAGLVLALDQGLDHEAALLRAVEVSAIAVASPGTARI